MSAYAWRIHRDHLAEQTNDSIPDSCGTIGPRDARDDLIARLNAGDGHTFRMYDDDGELYYTGRIVFDPPERVTPFGPDEAFGPLEDFGTPDSGCTEIRYQMKPGGPWVML